jgi:RNA polymerase sigma-70 factor (ECF subfamily)
MSTLDAEAGLETTQALVSRAQAGDRAALEAIARRYQPVLMRFAHGRLPTAARGMLETGDVVQLAVVRMLERLDAFVPTFRGSLLVYLRRAVSNQIRDEIRRAERRPVPEALTDDLPDLGPGPLQQLMSAESLARYETALAGLPADQQEAFLMRIEMNCSYRDIADALGRPSTESARSLVRRAIQTMARLLRRVGAR